MGLCANPPLAFKLNPLLTIKYWFYLRNSFRVKDHDAEEDNDAQCYPAITGHGNLHDQNLGDDCDIQKVVYILPPYPRCNSTSSTVELVRHHRSVGAKLLRLCFHYQFSLER
jgi:hypothetical protein